MLIFVEGGKPEKLEKNPWSKGENQQQTQLAYDAEIGNQTQGHMGWEASAHTATHASHRIPVHV
jgi:hypothetical protein